MPATGVAICAFILAVVVLIGGSVVELVALKRGGATLKRHK